MPESHYAHEHKQRNQIHGLPFGVQRKSLEVSEPIDVAEKEADEVARKVVAGQSAKVLPTFDL